MKKNTLMEAAMSKPDLNSSAQRLAYQPSQVPILRSFIVLRPEYFGGYMFNPYLPPELKLDPVRFKLASLCDGDHTVEEVQLLLSKDLNHNREYIDLIVNQTLGSFEQSYAIYWRNDKQGIPNQALSTARLSVRKIPSTPRLSAPLFVIWEITGLCNMRCRHCLADSGMPLPNELDTAEAKRVIDALAQMKVFRINVSGGEPLLRPDIHTLLKYASSKNIGIDLLTNGMLVTPHVLDQLEHTHIFNVQVSLDGLEQTHDHFRGVHGAYNYATTAIQHLVKSNYNVAVNSVVTKENLDEIPQIIDTAIALGASGYKTTLFMPAGRGKDNVESLLLTPQDVKRFTHMIITKKQEVGDQIIISSETNYPWLVNPKDCTHVSSCHNEDTLTVGCTAGTSSVYITPEGHITPCPFLRSFTAGNLRSINLQTIWDTSSTLDVFRRISRSDLKGKCQSCEYLTRSCRGGCRAAAYAHTGDLYAEDPLCWKHLS